MMCACIYVYTHTYIHTCIHTYIHTYIHTDRHTYIHACLTYVCISGFIRSRFRGWEVVLEAHAELGIDVPRSFDVRAGDNLRRISIHTSSQKRRHAQAQTSASFKKAPAHAQVMLKYACAKLPHHKLPCKLRCEIERGRRDPGAPKLSRNRSLRNGQEQAQAFDSLKEPGCAVVRPSLIWRDRGFSLQAVPA